MKCVLILAAVLCFGMGTIVMIPTGGPQGMDFLGVNYRVTILWLAGLIAMIGTTFIGKKT
jgi:hypothetical protein